MVAHALLASEPLLGPRLWGPWGPFCSIENLEARLQIPYRILNAEHGRGAALFVVSGAQKGLAFGLNPVMAVPLGMVTGVGGGMMRDILLAEIPTVLRADLYAIAALAGAAVVVIGNLLHLSPNRNNNRWCAPLLWATSDGHSL
jgi:hypothetical protein